MNPLVSIVIPSYNRAHLIVETIESVINQTFTNWECIIVDDGSTDTTEAVVYEYVKKDPRLEYYHRPDYLKKGPSSCRNYGLQLSKGEFVQWLDSDDLLLENKLQTDLEFIKNGNYDFTISQSSFFDNITKKTTRLWNSDLYSTDPINDFILKKIGWGVNSPLWRKKSLLDKHLIFKEELQNRNDYFFHLEALIKGFKPVVIDVVLVTQREHLNRIQNNIDKSDSKSLVNLYLLENSNTIKLNQTVTKFLKKQSLLILVRLYKRKRLLKALHFSWQLFLLPKNKRELSKIAKLCFLGFAYKICSLGYRFLDYNKL